MSPEDVLFWRARTASQHVRVKSSKNNPRYYTLGRLIRELLYNTCVSSIIKSCKIQASERTLESQDVIPRSFFLSSRFSFLARRWKGLLVGAPFGAHKARKGCASFKKSEVLVWGRLMDLYNYRLLFVSASTSTSSDSALINEEIL